MCVLFSVVIWCCVVVMMFWFVVSLMNVDVV